ncbi:hypothetical protein [Polaribacter aestuariivivens]|uniref:hypothetical protein n=1 Tax=Polaribacter aestuariivivens TaxID=2304626 RepID=UPI003F494161
MGGIVEDFSPLVGLKKLGTNHDFEFMIDGKNEDSRLSVNVFGFPTLGEYHLKFTKASGMDSTELKWWLDYDCLIFKTDSIKMNMEGGTVSIELCEENSDMCYYLENIKRVWRSPKEEIEISSEDIMKNEFYKSAISPKDKPSFLNLLFSFFKK